MQPTECHPPRADRPDDHSELKAFLDQALFELSANVAADSRFPNGNQLHRRFETAISRLFTEGWRFLDEVVEVQNEVCTADLILRDPEEPRCLRLEYEPAIPNCSKRFDFRADFQSLKSKWLEVKTIHPQRRDRWSQYERDVESDRFPENATLSLSKHWMGGELYHACFSARGRILEYTQVVEAKIAECLKGYPGPVFLVLFSNGFDWQVDTLEDYLHYYRYGRHFEGDHFSRMEEHHIQENEVTLTREIDYFAYFERPSAALRPTTGGWDVEPIRFSPEKGYY